MLVSAYTRRQDLGNIRIGDRREAIINSTRSRRIPLIGNLTQRHHERKDAVLVIEQVPAKIARLNTAKAKSRPAGKAQRVNCRRYAASEWNQTSIPAQLHTALDELLGKGSTVIVRVHKDIEPLLLELAGNFNRCLDIGSGACYRGKTRRGAINELNAALTHDHIVRRTKPEVVDGIGTDEVLARLDNLLGVQRRHPGIKDRA